MECPFCGEHHKHIFDHLYYHHEKEIYTDTQGMVKSILEILGEKEILEDNN
ncbi:hypothetical protein LCGC14_0458750 [marine sediment metagenome]|uniref:Uncharacterized protein n=1 Tax=marine sediment metagenome TaxID=412755 RepID=A0A0F9SYK8_9ZZZZ